MAPHAGDSPLIAQLRRVMNHDHAKSRVTLASSTQQPLHVFMHLLDPRFATFLSSSQTLDYSLFFSRCASWRVNRHAVLTAEQYEAVKALFLDLASHFFPPGMTRPVFVPMQHIAELKIDELQDELHIPPPPPLLLLSCIQEQLLRRSGSSPAVLKRRRSRKTSHRQLRGSVMLEGLHLPPAMRIPNIDMDIGVDIKQEGEDEKEHDIGWELHIWFCCPGSPGLSWKTDPTSAWLGLEQRFPLLSLLARRLLCVLPTSDSSEACMVWIRPYHWPSLHGHRLCMQLRLWYCATTTT